MIFFLTYWKPIVFITLIIACFTAGWHSHSWYDAYHSQKAENKAIDSLGKGEAAIIDVNQKIHRVLSNEKDDCANQSIPARLRKLLQ